MNPDTRDELILRHLDGQTTADEATHVNRLLAEDAAFRARFFGFVDQVAWLREILNTGMSGAALAADRGSKPEMHAVMNAPPKPRPAPAPAPVEAPQGKFDFRQIYFNAVLGGIGGLWGWAVITLAGSWLYINYISNVYLRDALIGPLLGICIGCAIGCTDGLVASRSLRRLVHGGLYGAGLGALGGLVGLLLGEVLFGLLKGGVWPRALGWAIFGLFVGVSDGFAQRMPAKIRYGLLGGLLGGLIGGSTYEGLVSLLGRSSFGNRSAALAWGSAFGLIILGACIGALVGLVESLLRQSWLFFITGRLEGQTRTLDSSRPHTLGSSALCAIVLPGDPTVLDCHAEISYTDGEFAIRPRDGEVVVKRGGRSETVSQPFILQPGDRIHLGDTKMVFRNEEKKKP
ncbi:MAG: FHA domain-containing protein [Planctomycetia bacterium]|nr:FHA domain-containing protein [Planctomycetia bacterium]